MKFLPTMLLCAVIQVYATAGTQDSLHHGRMVRFVLDNFYNNEWKTDANGFRHRYHYLWSDTLDSGFSQFGSIITASGGSIDTLCRAPTDAALENADVYIVVDPDTPKETASPEYISDTAAAIISRWVERGGILLVFGNDSGNAEFPHLNRLVAHFGIQYLDTSRNRVVGKDFAPGTFTALPGHPIFFGARKIYLKEISTLRLQDPARPLLVEGGDVIIAAAKYGKGLVFAVGDPWFYNEYMDHRKLPDEYDNARVAQNLVRWVMARARQGDRH